MRLIDADEFIKELSQLYAYAGWDKRDIHFSLSDVACNLEMMPVFNVVLDFQAETPKHGHWIEHDVGLICSECGHYTEAMYDEPFNNKFGKGWALKRPYYCGYCGAKMDEVEDETD